MLRRTGLRVDDMDVIEANEAFATQACAVAKVLELDPAGRERCIQKKALTVPEQFARAMPDLAAQMGAIL